MSALVIALVLAAAVLHAGWNALLRSGADRLLSMTIMSMATTAVALPCVLILPLPAAASWPYLCVSSMLQVGYAIFLVLSYRQGELGQVYPIIRGSAPALSAVGAMLFAGEHPGTAALAGIALVSGGIMSLSLGKGAAAPASAALAVVTGCFIAGYTVLDGIGARLSEHPQAYVAWIFVLYGAAMPVVLRLARGSIGIDVRAPETLKSIAGGLVSLFTYGLVVTALTLSPIGAVSALRETSVVFAALVGRVFLGEVLTLRRIAACIVVALGAVCLSSPL